MSSNPTLTPVIQQPPGAMSFKGKGNVTNIIGKIKPKNLSPEQAAMEKIAGATYGVEALKKSPEEVKERLMKEAISGNLDFVRGANEVLAKDAAKKIYKG